MNDVKIGENIWHTILAFDNIRAW